MKFGLPISLIAHSLFLVWGLFYFATSIEPLEAPRIIPVELVTISDQTNIRAAVRGKPETPPEDIMSIDTPMDNSENEGELQKRVDPEDTAISQPVKTSEIIDPNATAKEPDESETTAPKPLDLDRLSGLVNKTRDQAPEKNKQKALQNETNQYVFAEYSVSGSGEATTMSLSEVDALISAMTQCWQEPIAAPDPQKLIVTVTVKLFPDGEVENVEHDPVGGGFHRLAANRAVTAVKKCAPYDFLPPEKYSSWKEIRLTFRPQS